MRLFRNKNQCLVIFLAVGFLTGILYTNMISSRYVAAGSIFDEHFLKQYSRTEIIEEEYLWYILRARLFPLGLLCVIGCMKWKKALVAGCLVWTGFSGGVIAVSAVISLGIKGILFCAAGMLPQVLFYGFAYVVLLWYFYTYPNGRWNLKKTTVVVVTMAIGIIVEVYVNPLLMKAVIPLL